MSDSDSLFYLRNQFYLGAYRSVAKNPVPSPSHEEYLPTLLYTARSYIALNQPERALSIVPQDTQPSVRAVRSLAEYIKAKSSGGSIESILEELRDLAIEVEGEPEGEAGAGSGVVRVAAATAFLKEAEIEEALTTLGAGTAQKDLECAYLVVQIYLSINRIDLAKKEYGLARSHAPSVDDSLLIQLIEAAIGLKSGGPPLVASYHIFDEQSAAPGSSSNPAIISSKGYAFLLRGFYSEAVASFEEALVLDSDHQDALLGISVAKSLNGAKLSESDALFADLKAKLPNHQYVRDVEQKIALFDSLKTQYAPSVRS